MTERILYLFDEMENDYYKMTVRETTAMAKELESEQPKEERIKVSNIKDALKTLKDNWGIYQVTPAQWFTEKR